MPESLDLEPVAARLRELLERHASGLVPSDAYAGIAGWCAPYNGPDGKPIWFGGVRTGKRYVSYYLMPVYVFPDLLDGISPELRRRMQGKSCFNFARVDTPLFAELETLTATCIERMRTWRPTPR